MLQPLGEPSTTSPPCLLLRNYILLRGSPRCGLLPVSELWEGKKKKSVGEKEIGVCLKKGRYTECRMRVGVLLSTMGILLPSLLQRERGLRGICQKVERPHRFSRRGETSSCLEKAAFQVQDM